MTYSLFLNLICRIYNKLNMWYEQSLSHAIITKISNAFKLSRISMSIYSFFCVKNKVSYSEGSLIFKSAGFIADKLSDFLKWLYKVLYVGDSFAAKAIKGSLINYKGRFFEHSVCAFIFIALSVPHAYWSNGYLLIGAAVLLLVYAVQVGAGLRDSFSFKDIPACIIVFGLISALSLLTGYGGSDSLRVFVFLLSCMLITVLVQAAITSKESLRIIVFTLAAAVLFTTVYGIIKYRSGLEVRLDFIDTSVGAGVARLYSTMENPNNYAEFLIMLLPITVGAAFACKTDFWRLVAAGTSAIGLLALILTNSRSAYLALVLAAAFFVLLANKRLVPFFAMIGILTIPLIPDRIVARIMTIGRDTSSTYRIWVWQGALTTLSKNWLFGIGLGTVAFARVYRLYAHELALTVMHSHNLFLQIWIELGIFGIIAFIFLLFTTIKGAAATAINMKDTEIKYYAIGAASGLIAVLAIGLVEYIWFYPRIMLTFWIMIGLCSAVGKLKRADD